MTQEILTLELKDCTKEKSEPGDLQEIFNDWDGKRNGWRIAGAPHWLLKLGKIWKGYKNTKNEYGPYKLEIDALWEDAWILGELKRGNKNEAIGLAEVLHHAWHLGNPEVSGFAQRGFPRPFLMCSSSDGTWERGALCYLFRHGLRFDAISYFQATFLEPKDDGVNGPKYLWIDEPFGQRTPTSTNELPSFVPFPEWKSHHCYRIGESESWVLTPTELAEPLPSLPDTFWQIAAVTGSGVVLTYEKEGIRKEFCAHFRK
jgi:hypothetical protein